MAAFEIRRASIPPLLRGVTSPGLPRPSSRPRRGRGVAVRFFATVLLLWPTVALAQVLDTQFSTTNGTVHSIACDGNTIYIGGEFTQVQPPVGPPVARHFIAALDATTGMPTSWAPEANNYVRALLVSDGVVYAAGLFTSIGGRTRNRIAALDATTGAATDWDPAADNTVYALAASGSTILAGGLFTSIGGQTRNRIAALDAASGAATGWDPDASFSQTVVASVSTLMRIGDTVYVGGHFRQIGGQSRTCLAALDATTGAATAWDPSPGNDVISLAASGNTIYAGGGFYRIGGYLHNYVGAVDATTGVAIDWNPGLSGGLGNVRALVVNGNTVYIGGHFTMGEPLAPTGLEFAAVDATTGQDTGWHPDFCLYCAIRSMAKSGNTLYVGGEFTEPRAHLAAFTLDVPTPVLVSLVSVEAEPGRVRLTWHVADGRATVATVSRSTTAGDWQAIASVTPDGSGMLTYEDEEVLAGTRYGYRLGVSVDGSQEFLGETWVDVPRIDLALAGLRPNPAEQGPTIAFTLPDAAPARLEVVDVTGRRVFEREVGALGAGSHLVDLATRRPLPVGMYLIRLTRGEHSLTARGVVTR